MQRERRIYREISQEVGGPATVARVLQRAGLNRQATLEPTPSITRYEHDAPGDLLHLDIRKLGRFWRSGYRVTGSRRYVSQSAD